MSSRNRIICKIGDFLRNRDKQSNFGACQRCDKRVYWSTSKVASHIRSGHCRGASEDEVQQFKDEFVYGTPKNLVHKSVLENKFKDSFEYEEYRLVKAPKRSLRKCTESQSSKRIKIDDAEDDDYECKEMLDEDGNDPLFEPIEETDKSDEKIDFVYMPDSEDTDDILIESESKSTIKNTQQPNEERSREDKFIGAVYPQFKDKTKLQLIEDLIELKRINELLQNKAKNYENTINRLLN